MKKNLCKTLVMMLVMSSITLTVKATDLSDLFEVGKIYTIHEVGEIIKPYDDHIWADFYDATSVTIVFRFCSNYDDQGLLWWYNFDHESYTPTSEAKFLFNGNTFTAYEEYTPTLDVTGVGTLTVTPQPCGIGQTATISASGILGSIALMMGENGTDGTIELGKTYTYQQIVDFATSVFHFDANFDSGKLSSTYFNFNGEDIIEDINEKGLTVDEAKAKKWYAVSVKNDYEEDFSCSFICDDIPLTTVTEGKEYTFTMPCVNPIIKATFLIDPDAEYVIVTYKEGSDTKKAYYKTTDVETIEWLKGADVE